VIEARGNRVIVAFNGRQVVINRTHSNGFQPKGVRSIPVGQISAIHWKPAGSWSQGHIRFVLAGTSEHHYRQNQLLNNDVLKDQNAVPFTLKLQPEFERLKAAVEHAIAARFAPPSPRQPLESSPTLVDELVKLGGLVQAGLLSREEFEIAKARILGL
jgi:hypothetical protein